MGLPEILTVLFVVLKVTHVIDWSWWLVFLPTIIDAGLGVLLLISAAVGIGVLNRNG